MIRAALLTGAAALILAGGVQARIRGAEPTISRGDQCAWNADPDNQCGSEEPGASFQRNPATFCDFATGYDVTTMVPAGSGGALVTRGQACRNAIAGTGAFIGHQIDFDLPGVAYPEGDNPALETPLQSIPAGTVLAGTSATNGCAVRASGGGVNATSRDVFCTGALGNATVANVDFTSGGTDCGTYTIQNASGTLTLDNFRMQYSGSCVPKIPTGNVWLGTAFSPNNGLTSITMSHFFVDQDPPICAQICVQNPINNAFQLGYNGNGSTAVRLRLSHYASIHNVGRIVSAGVSTAVAFTNDHCYVEEIGTGAARWSQHSEIESITPSSGFTGSESQAVSYCTVVVPSFEPTVPKGDPIFHGHGHVTTPFFMTDTRNAPNTQAFDSIDHVLAIINRPDNGTFHTSAALAEITEDNYLSVTVTDDWADPNGASVCVANASATGAGATSPVFGTGPHAVTDLYDGSTQSTFDTGCNGHAPAAPP